MPTIHRTPDFLVYSAPELKEAFPKSYARAFERFQEQQDRSENFALHDLQRTFDKLLAVIGVEVKYYEYGDGCGASIKYNLRNDESKEFKGARAWAFFENNLFNGLRVPYSPTAKRYALEKKYGYKKLAFSRAGEMNECPLTGYCYDDDFIRAIKDALRAGKTVDGCIKAILDCADNLARVETEHARSEEVFLDSNDLYYDENGIEVAHTKDNEPADVVPLDLSNKINAA